MKNFKVSAQVLNVYDNGENSINTIYRATNKKEALKGFKSYLSSNKNLVSFKNIVITEI